MTPVAAYTWKRHSLFGSANIPSARSPYTISHINTCLTHTHVSPCFLTLSPFWPTAKLYFTIRVDSHLLGICAYLQIPLLLVFLLVLQVFSMLLASMSYPRVPLADGHTWETHRPRCPFATASSFLSQVSFLTWTQLLVCHMAHKLQTSGKNVPSKPTSLLTKTWVSFHPSALYHVLKQTEQISFQVRRTLQNPLPNGSTDWV